jgi:hypothetical protein
MCEDVGYRLIHIWSDDFEKNKERELLFIKSVCGNVKDKPLYARKTTVKLVEDKESVNVFMDLNHIQGKSNATFNIGLFVNDEMVGVGAFISRGENGFELIRYCAKRKIIGGLGKITKWMAKNVCNRIFTFCDNSRFNGASYEHAGYYHTSDLKPDYKYIVDNVRRHKFGFRRVNIERNYPEFYSNELTEKQMMLDAGICRIYDCGKKRFEYKG